MFMVYVFFHNDLILFMQAEPADMLQVEPGLFIGTVDDLKNKQALTDAAVTHILSVCCVDPGPLLSADGSLRSKWLNVLDEVTSDLLSHMDSCFLFIQEAVEGHKAAFVCW